MTGTNRIQRGYALGPFGQIHYRKAGPAGARSPLVLLHPVPSSGYVFEDFMAEMGHDRSVLAPDLPGYGMTDPPRLPPTMTHYAAAMLELVAELGLGVVDLMGYHTGAAVAAEMAKQQPNVVRKIVMISAPLFNDDERKRARGQPAVFPADDRAAGMPGAWKSFKNDFWRMGTEGDRTWNLYLEGQRSPETSPWGQQALLAYELAETLAAIDQPVLVLNPDDDLKDFTPRAAALLKNGRIHNLPGWTHGFLDSKTGETADIVRAFLDGQ